MRVTHLLSVALGAESPPPTRASRRSIPAARQSCSGISTPALAAWLFIKWFTEPEHQDRGVSESSCFFVRRRIARRLGSYFRTAYNLLEYGKPEPSVTGTSRDLMLDAMVEVLEKGADMGQTLKQIEIEADKTLAMMEDLNREGVGKPLYVHMGLNSGIALVGSSRFESGRGTRWTFTASGSVRPASGIGQRRGRIVVGPETARRLGDATASNPWNLSTSRTFRSPSRSIEIRE